MSTARTAARRELARQHDREAPAPRAHVDDRPHVLAPAPPLADGFDDELGFGPGDEHVRRDVKVQPPELAMPGDEGDRLARGAPLDERREALVDVCWHRAPPVGQEAGAIPAERVARQYFGVDSGVLVHEARAHQRLAGVSDALVNGSH